MRCFLGRALQKHLFATLIQPALAPLPRVNSRAASLARGALSHPRLSPAFSSVIVVAVALSDFRGIRIKSSAFRSGSNYERRRRRRHSLVGRDSERREPMPRVSLIWPVKMGAR